MLFRRSSRAVPLALLIACCSAAAQAGSQDDARATFRIGVDTVFVQVSVSDASNRFVDNLAKENFRVFEDSVEQTLTHFTQESVPVSAGVLLDTSRSMKQNFRLSRESVIRFLEPDNPEDEFFVISFNQRCRLLHDFTRDPASVRKAVLSIRPQGRTAFFDAVTMGIEQMRNGRNPKRALILITDGEDNSSRHSAAQARELARESRAQIYAIGESKGLASGRSEIQALADLTGGRAYFPESLSDLDTYIELIRAELSHQYVLGYVPVVKPTDGEWRRIEVRLRGLEEVSKLAVRASQGYFASRK
jgi:Ca-activated chloride channel family protein